MGYIYLITNIINGHRYIGQTICSDVNTRWKQHKRKDPKTVGRYLLGAYEKYGIENFHFQIICICFDEDCNDYEEDYIKKYNTLAPNGYNLAAGGKNSKQHPLTIEKRATKLRGNKYRKRTEEERILLSKLKQGQNNPNFGKAMSDLQKKKISDTMKKKYINNKIDLSGKKIKPLLNYSESLMKKVGKFNKNGEIIDSYNSISEASRINNISFSNISKVCNNINYSAGGFLWKFLSDDKITS